MRVALCVFEELGQAYDEANIDSQVLMIGEVAVSNLSLPPIRKLVSSVKTWIGKSQRYAIPRVLEVRVTTRGQNFGDAVDHSAMKYEAGAMVLIDQRVRPDELGLAPCTSGGQELPDDSTTERTAKSRASSQCDARRIDAAGISCHDHGVTLE